MPKRPKQHISADQGVAEIARILSDAGWACESVQADYGEDLICQTAHEGAVDPHRILVQVKSTRRKLTTRNAYLLINRGTLLKWLSDSNLVVVCLWSVADKSALYVIPSDHLGLFRVDLSREKSFRLEMPLKNRLDQRAANEIAWRSRFRNINRHFLERKSILENLQRDKSQTKAEFERSKFELQQDIGSVLIKFLVYIGLVRLNDNHVTVDTRAYLHEMLHFGAVAKQRHELKKIKLKLEAIFLLVILLRASRTVPKVGFPIPLVEAAAKFYLSHILETIRKHGYGKATKQPSQKRLRDQVTSLARRLWILGSKFSPQQIAGLVGSDNISSSLGMSLFEQATKLESR
jgi:Domain of unknown function (DUF4365)